MNYKLLLIVTFISGFIFACGYREKLKQGNEIVIKVEKFRNEKGRLPKSLSEIGIVEKIEGPVYYRKESENKYIIWFGKEFGESAIYDSDTKQWSNL